jgi:fumarate hydratase class I
VVVFVKVGMGVRWRAERNLDSMINEGVRRAYLNPDNKLRASIVSDPAFSRPNTRDNTPAVIHTEFGPGDEVQMWVAAKGGGSENKSLFAMLNPSDSARHSRRRRVAFSLRFLGTLWSSRRVWSPGAGPACYRPRPASLP